MQRERDYSGAEWRRNHPPASLPTAIPGLIRSVVHAKIVHEAFARIARDIVETLGARSAAAYCLGVDGRTLALVTSHPDSRAVHGPIDVSDAALVSRAVQRRKVLFEDEPAPSWQGEASDFPCVQVAIPLLGDRRVFGVVSAQIAVRLAPEDVTELIALAEFLGAALELLLLRMQRSEREHPEAASETALPGARRAPRVPTQSGIFRHGDYDKPRE
ncbi:MAG: GAF domain-containing protein [Myxococcota bacterium]